MSAGRAPDSNRIDRAAGLADRLLAFPEVAAARCAGGHWLVVPSAAGIRRVKREGRAALIREWRASLDSEPTAGIRWRIVEALPPVGSAAEKQLLGPLCQPWVDAIETTGPGAMRFALRVPLDLDVFQGHFATIPIVPAVTQVDWVMRLLRVHLQPDARCARLPAAKFRRLMRPAMALALSIQLEDGRARFEYCSAGSPVSSGRIELETGHA